MSIITKFKNITNYYDFYIQSENGQKVYWVDKNVSFCQNMLAQLKNLFTLKILHEILTRSMMPNYDNPNTKYCVCGRPSFEPMIACDTQLLKWATTSKQP